MILQNFDVKDFLNNYWQKKPLVIRRAFKHPDWLEPGDVAGLACEEDVESRLIMEDEGKWLVECGPFEEDRFGSLPEKDWTLLVQGVDQWVPEVRDILDSFTFLPSWRLDDIMVSYAPEGGTVSQHYDFFDVFLIQGEGSRKWQVGQVCGSHSELLPDTSVRILKDFESKLEVTLEPGDILYIPAKHSHLGVSVEDSLTYSVGFRAPSIRDIVDGVATNALETLKEDDRYQDSIESLMASSGEISGAAIQNLTKMLTQALTSEGLVSSWLGEYVSERKYPELDIENHSTTSAEDALSQGVTFVRNPASRFCFVSLGACTLFVDGESFGASLKSSKLVSEQQPLESQAIQDAIEDRRDYEVFEALLKRGALYIEE